MLASTALPKNVLTAQLLIALEICEACDWCSVENPQRQTNTYESILCLIHRAACSSENARRFDVLKQDGVGGEDEEMERTERRHDGSRRRAGEKTWASSSLAVFPLRLRTKQAGNKSGQGSTWVRELLTVTQRYMTENTTTGHSSTSKHAQNPIKCCITDNLQDVHLKLPRYPYARLNQKKKKKNNNLRIITRNKDNAESVWAEAVFEFKSWVCIRVSPSRALVLVIPVSQQRKVLCWHSNTAESWPVAIYPACIPAFCFTNRTRFTRKEGSPTPKLWPL